MASSPLRWVILVGIDFYVDVNRRLKGAVHDVELAELFLSKSDNPHSLVKFLAADRKDITQSEPDGPESSWPTYSNIASELRRVSQAASPGDFVYFHYSGHGSLSPTSALEYEENFGSDAALVLFDKPNKNGVRYMRGIELAALFDVMVGKGLKLTVVLDCCHAGSLSRGQKIAIRSIPWDDDVASAYPPDYPPGATYQSWLINYGHRDASTSQHWLMRPRDYVLIAACGPNEIATECRGKDGRPHGTLTYYLFKSLFKASTKDIRISLGNIYQQLCAELHTSLPQQHPMLLGNHDSIFFSAKSLEQRFESTSCVISILSDSRIWLNIGLAQGVCLQDDYQVYSNEEMKKVPKESAVYRITAVHAFFSEGKLLQAAPKSSVISKGWHATLLRPAQPKAQVVLESDAGSKLSDLVNGSDWLDLTDTLEIVPDSLPLFQVRLSQQKEYIIHIGGTEEPQETLINTGSDSDASQRLIILLEHLARFASIERLGIDDVCSFATPNSNMPVRSMPQEVQIVDRHGDYSIQIKSKDNPERIFTGHVLSISDGERITVRFMNHAPNSLYLTVIDLQPLRAAVKIYPSSDRGYYKEVPPKSAHFKGEISFTMRMSIPEALRSKGQLQVEDVLKLFITTRATSRSFELLEMPELSSALTKRQQAGADRRLLQFLQERRTFIRNEGQNGGTRMTDSDRWTCRNVVFRTTASV